MHGITALVAVWRYVPRDAPKQFATQLGIKQRDERIRCECGTTSHASTSAVESDWRSNQSHFLEAAKFGAVDRGKPHRPGGPRAPLITKGSLST